MISRAAVLHAALASLLAAACSLDLERGQEAPIARNECSQNSDCGPGECWQGACVAHEGELSSVFLEVAPPTGAGANVGGLRFLQNLPELSRSSSDKLVELEPAIQVVGSLLAQSCGGEARSFPVEVTFTPREDSYGLPVVTYTAKTRRVNVVSTDVCAPALAGFAQVDQFAVVVPSGSYDVYVKPLPDESEPGCVVAPQLIRRKSFVDAAQLCLPIPWLEPRKLTVAVPWQKLWTGEDSLDGWKIDVVHPITNQILSTPTLLSESDRSETSVGPGYRSEVFYSPVPADETVKEIVRLSPPPGIVAPVVQADRTGLQALSDEATFPSIGPFLPPVTVEGWVQPEGEGAPAPPEGGIQIQGRAVFTATSLTGIRAGVFASYSTRVVVKKDGMVSAELLPGGYRLRVVPDIGMNYAATETPVSVSCQADPEGKLPCVGRGAGLPRQVQGKTFWVKPAAALTGGVRDASSGERVGQVAVDALPASVGTRTCASDPSNVACAVAPVGVLDIALGDDPFLPRGVSGVVQSGRFTLTGLDCGGCTEESGALFDVVVKPPEESRRAWALLPSIKVYTGEVNVGDVELPLPVIHRGTVESRAGKVPVPVNRALLRAYVLRDETGAVIADPTGLPSCTMVASAGAAAPTTHCIRSALQVAQTTADDEGRYDLVLPSRIQEIE